MISWDSNKSEDLFRVVNIRSQSLSSNVRVNNTYGIFDQLGEPLLYRATLLRSYKDENGVKPRTGPEQFFDQGLTKEACGSGHKDYRLRVKSLDGGKLLWGINYRRFTSLFRLLLHLFLFLLGLRLSGIHLVALLPHRLARLHVRRPHDSISFSPGHANKWKAKFI
jgi:hypothetical protein